MKQHKKKKLKSIQLKVLIEKPPILEKLNAKGIYPDLKKVVFTYGSKIYNPGDCAIPDHLMHHEKVHCKQQGDNPDAWWDKYIDNALFRIEQEVEAYARQYEFICKFQKDRNERNNILMILARSLSGPTYGNVINQTDAFNLIKQESNI